MQSILNAASKLFTEQGHLVMALFTFSLVIVSKSLLNRLFYSKTSKHSKMNMRFFSLKSIVLAGSLAATVCATQAEYVWVEPASAATDGKARGYVGELDAAKRLPANAVASPRAFLADEKDLPLAAEKDFYAVQVPAAAAATAPGDIRLLARRVGDDGSITFFQAKFGRAETKAVNDLELVPLVAGGNTFQLVWKGRKVSATQVNVQTSDGWRRVLKPAEDGTVSITTPFPGLYVLEVSAKVNGLPTIVDGKKYEDVRHTATISFEVPK
jgi:hypothetical protein